MANATAVINDDSFEIAEELLVFDSNDENSKINKWIDKLAQIRQNLQNRCWQLIDTLDATIDQHAKEMALCKQEHEFQLIKLNEKLVHRLELLNNSHNENQMKTAACQQVVDLLQSIQERKCHININICF